jgi:hypothetical protein
MHLYDLELGAGLIPFDSIITILKHLHWVLNRDL